MPEGQGPTRRGGRRQRATGIGGPGPASGGGVPRPGVPRPASGPGAPGAGPGAGGPGTGRPRRTTGATGPPRPSGRKTSFTRKCRKCDEEVPFGERKCPSCGAPVGRQRGAPRKGGCLKKIVILLVLVVLAVGVFAVVLFVKTERVPAFIRDFLRNRGVPVPEVTEPEPGAEDDSEEKADEEADEEAEEKAEEESKEKVDEEAEAPPDESEESTDTE